MNEQLADVEPNPENPFVGPTPIQDRTMFFGRDREIAELRDTLIAERIVLLYSPSGAGKTSLIHAGLLPELNARGFLVLPTIRVSSDVLWERAEAGQSSGNRYLLSTLQSLEEGLFGEKDRLSFDALASTSLDEYLGYVAEMHGDGVDPVLIFDQFEELLTLDPTDQAAKAEFMADLGVALRNPGRWALFSMREDFVTQLDPYLKHISTRLRNHYRLDLLDPSAARLAVQGPAARHNVEFTDEAALRLIDDLRRVQVQRGSSVVSAVGPFVEPVQLQVVCHRLWNNLFS